MFIDSHAHLVDKNLADFIPNDDLDAIISSSYNASNIEKTLEIALKHEKCYATLGIHPQFCDEYTNEIEKNIIKNKLRNKFVGIGEIGLDKHYNTDFSTQKNVFQKQLNLAQELQLPVVCHVRDCYGTFFDIMRKHNNLKFMLHAFCGTKADCFKAIELGGYISFACNITYKRHDDLRKIATAIPLEKILIETDSPSMLPAKFMRKGFNTPNNVRFVAETIARARNTSVEEIAQVTKQNAIELFDLKL